MSDATIGGPVRVTTHPDANNGSDYARGFVTGVNEDGTVNVTVLLDGSIEHLRGVPYHDSRDQLDRALDEHHDALAKTPKGRDADGNPIPWKRHDVYRWQRHAWPVDDDPELVDDVDQADELDELVDDPPAPAPTPASTAPARKKTSAAAARPVKAVRSAVRK